MIDPKIEPMSVPIIWQNFLYRSVLLPWETKLRFQTGFPRFDHRKQVAGISLIKFNHLREVKQAWEVSKSKNNFGASLTFYSNGTALKDLLNLLRNCAAHGHYTQHSKNGWIFFKHEYKGNLKLYGKIKFSSLKELIEFIGNHHD